MFRKLLIANRGEIAVRVIRTARAMGIRTVAVYSDADRNALHVEMADEAWRIGPPPAATSYLDQDAIMGAARLSGADALHPGYGFLSENAVFAAAVADAGLTFVGPPPAAMRKMGLKNEARCLMQEAGIPVIPGYDGNDQSIAKLTDAAQRIGYPVLIKPLAGGGGRGMRIVRSPSEFASHAAAAEREANSAFGDGRVLIEKYLPAVRHIEVQVMADSHGHVLHLWERDCSLQRRHQKLIEEAPAPSLPPAMRASMCDAAVEAARRVGYVNAGTVEFLAPVASGMLTGEFYFIEMNTRLQVEHPVTEAITGLDLVALQLRIAAGEEIGFTQHDVKISGHAIEARLYAEDPAQSFTPQTGMIRSLSIPQGEGLRFDGGPRAGDHVTPFYDAMIGKLIAHGPTREAALTRLADALSRTQVNGLVTNLSFLTELAMAAELASATMDTALIERHLARQSSREAPPLLAIAGAVLLWLGRLTLAPEPSLFSALRGFQLWGGSRRMILLWRTEELMLDITEARRTIQVSLEGVTICVALLRSTEDEMWLSQEDRVSRLLWQRDDGRVTITLDGQRFTFSRAVPAEEGAEGQGTRLVTSPVPGRLSKFLVQTGDDVKAGDVVAVVEAMKTEFNLKADSSGPVHLLAAEGDQVKEGCVIARIGDADG
jgi:3-methylcrotonyl-CoA carboxylase alpha subunit